MKALLGSAGLLAAVVLLAAGCGGAGHGAATTSALARYYAGFAPPVPMKATCAHPLGWERLANRIGAAVYCPGWLPDPLTSQIGGQWNNINAVGKDRSYLESFVWQDTDTPNISGEFHINLRGYPGRTTIPTCLGGLNMTTPVPCFAQPTGHVTENGIRATLYTVNQDADTWHLLLLWRHAGGLYTVSEHLAPPLDYHRVVEYLKVELASLVLIPPARST